MDIIKVVCGIIYKNDKIFICRRKPGKVLGGFWEFPGGKIEANESYKNCLLRELKEELKMVVEIEDHFKTVFYSYDKINVELISYTCSFKSFQFEMLDHDMYKWIGCNDLLNKKLAPADILIAKAILLKNK